VVTDTRKRLNRPLSQAKLDSLQRARDKRKQNLEERRRLGTVTKNQAQKNLNTMLSTVITMLADFSDGKFMKVPSVPKVLPRVTLELEGEAIPDDFLMDDISHIDLPPPPLHSSQLLPTDALFEEGTDPATHYVKDVSIWDPAFDPRHGLSFHQYHELRKGYSGLYELTSPK
jgi:hypothetical protein